MNVDAETTPQKHEHKQIMVFVPFNIGMLYGVLKYLGDNLRIYENKVLILCNEPDCGEDKYIVIFKLPTDYQFDNEFKVTVNERPFSFRLIQVHSKSKHRVYYTLNALNKIIQLDAGADNPNPKHEVDWSKYENRVYYLQQEEMREIRTELFGIVNLDPKLEAVRRTRKEQ